jgi:hypothetical protein
MTKVSLILIASLCAVFSTGASANWQYTRWGMTQEQVSVASGKTTLLAPEEQSANSAANSLETALLQAPYSSGQYQFDVIFSFDKSKGTLAHVKLKLINTDRAVELLGSLRTKYGKPENEKSGDVLSYATWYSGGDQISYVSIGNSTVSVDYQPRITTDNSGL